VQVLFGYYAILQAKLSELEKKMRRKRRRRAVLSGGFRGDWAFWWEEEKGRQHFVFRGEMDDNVHAEIAKMRPGWPESKECVGRT
jgi:hypothetical protein